MAVTQPLYVYEKDSMADVHFQTFTDAGEAEVHAKTWEKRGYGVVLLVAVEKESESK